MFDLQKAYDSVELPVLLDCLYNIGVNGKMWRLIKNWYHGGECSVKLNGELSTKFPIMRGVRQGSILSPTLFLTIMDPLLRKLESSKLGLSINNLFMGAYLHADDIHTLYSSKESLDHQLKEVLTFTEENFLTLNPSKCEVLCCMKGNCHSPPTHVIGNTTLPVSNEAKYLGYTWTQSLSASNMIEQNILKARRAFFASGSIGAFQGALSPIVGRSVVETCVFPVLLYGCEHWCLTDTIINMLDSFIGELSKRILNQPKWYDNTAAMLCMGWGSIRALCFSRKAGFLHRITSDTPISEQRLGQQTLRALADDTSSILLIKECEELDDHFGTSFTASLLEHRDGFCPSKREMTKDIQDRELALFLKKCDERKVPTIMTDIEEKIGWIRLWSLSMDQGHKGVSGLKAFVRIVCHPPHALKLCPKCDATDLGDESLLSHVITQHLTVNYSEQDVLSVSKETVLSFITRVIAFHRLF